MKGMQKIVHGKGFRGVLKYAAEKDFSRLLGGNMSGLTPRELAKEFGSIRKIRPDIEKPVWHQSLRLPKGDSLNDDEWVAFADDYMKRMGFTDQHARTYWMHDEDDGQHIHIIACRVALDGKVHDSSHQSMKSTPILGTMEREYRLTVTPGPTLDDSGKRGLPMKRRLKKGEIEQALRTGEEPARQKLQRIIDEAKADKPSAVQFAESLEMAGVTVIANLAGTGRLNGFSFEIDGVAFKGSQLGKSYAWGLLSKEVVYEQARDCEGLRRFSAAVRRSENNERATKDHRADAAPVADEAEFGRSSESVGAFSSVAGHVDGGKQGGDSFSERSSSGGSESVQGTGSAFNWDSEKDGVKVEGNGGGEQKDHDGDAPLALDSRFVFKPADSGSYQRVLDLTSSGVINPAQAAKLDVWRKQHDALRAPLYRLTLTARRDGLKTYNHGKGKGEDGDERFYKAQEVADMIPFLSRQNARGYDIYVTPIDPDFHYFVVDDMTDESLGRFYKGNFQPVIVQSSSKGNFQCVIKTVKDSSFKNEQSLANKIVRDLNVSVGDPNFSGVVHPFRMAGFSNKKEGRHDFFTRIVKAEHVICDVSVRWLDRFRTAINIKEAETKKDKARAVVKPPRSVAKGGSGDSLDALCLDAYASVFERVSEAGWQLDMSRVDFSVAKVLLSNDVSVDDVERLLLAHSDGIYERHSNPVDYVHRTVVNALIELEQAQRSSFEDFPETDWEQDVGRSSMPRARF